MERRIRRSYRVRYDEGNMYGYLTPAAALRYLQDIASQDAAEAPPEGGDWIARRTTMDFFVPIPVLSTLNIETFSPGFTKVTAQRGYEARLEGLESPELALKALTLWVYLDSRGRPARIPSAYHNFWQPDGPKPLLPVPDWPAFPVRAPFITGAVVRFSDLDLMLHMNNAAYVELLDNAGWESLAGVGLPPDAGLGHPEPLFYDIEYQASAQAGELVEVQSWFAPVSGQATDFERLQLVKGSGRTLAQARSRWGWRFPPDTDAPEVEARLARLWKE